MNTKYQTKEPYCCSKQCRFDWCYTPIRILCCCADWIKCFDECVNYTSQCYKSCDRCCKCFCDCECCFDDCCRDCRREKQS